jgi:PAS domain S-box-containing protein
LANSSDAPVGLSGDPAALVLVLIVLFGALALLGAFIIFSRRRHVREMRELVLAIEELRRGRPEADVELGSGSSLGLIADAINRLSQDLTARRRESASVSQRMRAAIDAAEDMAVITTDTDGDIRSFSRGATVLYGWEEGEVLGRSAAMLFSESSFKEFLPKLTRQSSRERGVSTRVEQHLQDGSSFPVEVSVRTLLGPEHQAIGFLMLAKDITAQLQLEERLRESEARYRSLIEGLTEGVAIVQRGKLVFVNPAFCKLSGRTRDKLIGGPLRKLVATRDLLLMEERLAEVEGGTRGASNLRVGLTDDRGEALAELRLDATAIQVAGEPAVLLLARDDTARHRLELELRRNEARLDAVLESAGDGILVLVDGPEGGRVQICNSAFAAMLDVSPREVLGSTGKGLADLLRGRSGAGALRDVLGSRRPSARGPRSITTSEGRKIDASSTPLHDRDGRPLGRVVTCKDVTRRRHSEEQLQEFAERLQLSKVELESAYNRLEEMHESVEGRALELDRLN